MVSIICTLLTCLTIACTFLLAARLVSALILKINKANHEHELKIIQLNRVEVKAPPVKDEKPEQVEESEAASFLQILSNPDILMEEFEYGIERDNKEV